MKRRGLKKAAIMIAAVLIAVQCAMPVSAYFDRGAVSISTGKSSVTLTAGSSETVSVSMSPASSTQLPGCGMAECPQTCGEKACLDENGECTCNGKTPQTYYAYASVSSSNTSVATASCDNGTVTIKGVSAGTATITLTASLRQYSSSSTSIQVTVQNKENESSNTGGNDNSSNGNSGNTGGNSNNTSGNTGGNSSAGGNNGSNASAGQTSDASAGNVSVTKVSGNDENSDKEEETAQEDEQKPEEDNGLPEGVTSVESDRGIIYFVPITAGKTGSEWLSRIQGKEEYVDFQVKDESDTVLYAWEFYGMDINTVMDMDYTIESSATAFDGCSYGSSADTLYLLFAHEGELPGKASVFLRVDGSFTDEDLLNLYCYDEDTDTVTPVQQEISCENGYVTMELEHCSRYILTTQTLENKQPEEVEEPEIAEEAEEPEVVEETGQKAPVKVIVTVVVIVIVAAAVAGTVCYRRKKK